MAVSLLKCSLLSYLDQQARPFSTTDKFVRKLKGVFWLIFILANFCVVLAMMMTLMMSLRWVESTCLRKAATSCLAVQK